MSVYILWVHGHLIIIHRRMLALLLPWGWRSMQIRESAFLYSAVEPEHHLCSILLNTLSRKQKAKSLLTPWVYILHFTSGNILEIKVFILCIFLFFSFCLNICTSFQHFLIWRCSYLTIQSDSHYACFTNVNTIWKEQVAVYSRYILNIKIN